MPLGIDITNLSAGGAIGAVAGYAATAFLVWRRRPFVKLVDFVRAEPAYDFSPVAGGPAYYGEGHLYKVLLVISGRDALGAATLEFTYTAPGGATWRRYGKWDEAPNPLNWEEPAQFWPALVPACYQQVLQFGRVYAAPIVWVSPGQVLLFSGWLFGKDRYTGSEPNLQPDGTITLTLAGQGLNWTGTVGLRELLANAPALAGADSDDKQDTLQVHVAGIARPERTPFSRLIHSQFLRDAVIPIRYRRLSDLTGRQR